MAYMGLYSISGELDRLVVSKDIPHAWKGLLPSIFAIQVALIIQVVKNYNKRAEIAKALGQESKASFFGATGLTTLFNALT